MPLPKHLLIASPLRSLGAQPTLGIEFLRVREDRLVGVRAVAEGAEPGARGKGVLVVGEGLVRGGAGLAFYDAEGEAVRFGDDGVEVGKGR